MKNFKKLFASVAIVAMLASTVPSAVLGAATYSAELEGAYEYAYDNGITTMSSIENADMYGSLTRVAMAKMMANYSMEVLGQTPNTTLDCSFPDVTSALDDQYDGGVTNACQLGLMGVGIENFNPYGLVTRAEFGTVLSRAIWGDTYNDGDPYYADHLAALQDADIMNNISTPTQLEVRGYVMLMMQRADEMEPAICQLPENVLACSLELDTCPTECQTVVPVVPGFVTVTSMGSTETQYVASNALSKKIGTIKITAGENDSTVWSIVISHAGLGNAADIEGVQLFLSNGVAATNNRPMSTSTETSTLRFSPALELKAGSSMTFDVMVDLDGDVNNRHEFAVKSVNVANGTASGLPITLANILTTSYVVEEVTTTFTAGTSIAAGNKQELIATVGLSPQREAIVKGFTLTRTAGEDIDEAFSNVKAYYNDEVVGTVTLTNEELVVSDLNINRLNGETATIELKADGIYIGAASSVTLQLQDNDLTVTEKVTGEKMRQAAIPAAAAVTLDAVEFDITKVSTGAITVAPGASSVKLLNAKINADTDFEVSQYVLTVKRNGAAPANLADFTSAEITLYINGVDTPLEMADLPGGIATFTLSADSFVVEKNVPTTVQVMASIASTVVGTQTWDVNFKVVDVKNLENGEIIAGVNEDVDSHRVTIKNGTATAQAATLAAPTSTNIYASAEDLEIGRFAIKAEAEDVTVKKLTFTDGGTLVDLTTAITDAKLVDINTNATIPATVTVNVGTIVFENISAKVTKDTTRNFKVVVDTEAFAAALHNRTVQFTVNMDSVTKASGGSATLVQYVTALKTYVLGVQAPVVTIAKKDASTFTVVVKNIDNESDINLQSITARIRPVATDLWDYDASYFLRDNGSSITDSTNLVALGNISTTVWAVPGAATALVITAPQLIAQDGSTYTYEIYVDSDYVNPVNLLGEITAVTYDGVTELYSISAQ